MSVYTRISLFGCLILSGAGLYLLRIPPPQPQDIPPIDLQPTKTTESALPAVSESAIESAHGLGGLFSALSPPLPEETLKPVIEEEEAAEKPIVILDSDPELEPVITTDYAFITELSDASGRWLYFFKKNRTGRFFRVSEGASDGPFFLKEVLEDSFIISLEGDPYVILR